MKKDYLLICIFLPVLTAWLYSADGYIKLNRVSIAFPTPVAEDLDRGYIDGRYTETVDLSMQVGGSGNKSWHLYISCEQPYFMPVHINKPHYDLMWKLKSDPDSKYRSIRHGRTHVVSGRSVVRVDLDFRMSVGWQDTPANYIIELLFEIHTADP